VGELLFGQYLLPFEVTSILLLAAMVGAIVMTRDEPKEKP
jgi:NADH-quinone oxidoreductase subunit J